MSALHQSKLRIDRAEEKLTDLKLAIKLASKDALQVAAEQADFDAAEPPIQEFSRQLWEEAPLLVSEFALHARVALDYVVFALARKNTGIEQKGTQFPINDFPEEFERNRRKGGCLEHVAAEHITTIERFQPYKGFRLECLSLLHALSNRDKHRQFVHLSFMSLGHNDPNLQTSPPFAASAGEMEVNLGRTYHVLLYEGGFEIGDVLETLAEILAKVREIVEHFDGILG